MMISLKWCLSYIIFTFLYVTIIAQRNPYSDLPPGPYCASRQCCPGRQDECSAPILGTLCYCDEFCNHTRVEDCCPDYWSHCMGLEPPTTFAPLPPPRITSCSHEGRNYGFGQTIKKNCNICKCEQIGNNLEFLCERNECMISNLIIDTVNRERRYGWTASNNSKFWGKTLEEGMATRLGTLQPERFIMNMNPVKKIYDPNSLPREFDASTEWPNYIGGIQDQGDCASSWAISTAAVASDRFAIVSKGRENIRLSAQNLISCDRRGQQSCKGGYLDKAWAFIKRFGLVEEDCFPYAGYDTDCKIDLFRDLRSNGCRLPQNGRTSKYLVAPAYRLGNETDIMFEILKSGPVQATMLVHNDFFSYGGGVYEHTDILESRQRGYLSVRIVGWGEEYNFRGPRKFWKVANSWGQDWGENGYFRISRGNDESEIESFVIAAWPEVERQKFPSVPMPLEPDTY